MRWDFFHVHPTNKQRTKISIEGEFLMDNGASSYRRFLSGEKDGLSEIIRTYNDGLIFYINSLVNNVNTAEELTQDVFALLIAKKPAFHGRSSFKTWLYAIARNIAVDHIRHFSKLSDTSVDEMSDLSDSTDLEKRYIHEEQKIMLHRAISRLHTEYSQILYLVYFEGFDNTETAKIIKKTKRQVVKLLYNAKQALKKELEKEGFEYEEL